jgi:hypothetical protein
MGEEYMPTSKLNIAVIEAAILGFEQQKVQIDAQITELRAMLSGGPVETIATPEVPTGKRKQFSAAARRRMALAQKKRWEKIKGEVEPPAPAAVVAPKPKRKLSAAGRAAIIAATKKMWAAKKAAAKAKSAVIKKIAPTRKKVAVKKAAAKKTTPAAAEVASQ